MNIQRKTIGMRKSLLKKTGRRRGLKSLYDSPRFEDASESRTGGHNTHKDKVRHTKPWADKRAIAKIESIYQQNASDPEFLRDILTATMVTSTSKHGAL